MSRMIDDRDEGDIQPTSEGDRWVLDDGQEEGITDLTPEPEAPAVPATPEAPATGTPAGGYEMRSATGHVFRGATPEEALAQAEAYYRRTAAPAPPVQYQAPSTGAEQAPAPSPWDNEAFFKAFATNPRDAMEMWFEHRFGETPDSVINRLDSSYAVSTQVSDRIAVADFLSSHPDFPASQESAQHLINRLSNAGAEVTSWNLAVAYQQLVNEGALAPLPVEQEQPPQRQFQQQPQPPAPAPSRGRGAPPAPPAPSGGEQIGDRDLSLDEFEQLSTPQMRQYLQRQATRRGR